MKSTVVDESLSSYQPMYCSREYQASTSIPQLGICNLTIKHKYKQKLHRFFVVPGNGPAILGMLEIEVQGILSMKYRTVDPQKQN